MMSDASRAIADATLRPQQCAACWSSVFGACLLTHARVPRALFRARDACCLVSVCTEYVGVVARALGRDFVTLPRMLPVLLAPMLEKLGDPSNEVREHDVCMRPRRCLLTAT